MRRAHPHYNDGRDPRRESYKHTSRVHAGPRRRSSPAVMVSFVPFPGVVATEKTSAKARDAAAHVFESVPLSPGPVAVDGESATVVLDDDLRHARRSDTRTRTSVRARVFEDVVEGFLDHKKQVVPGVRRQRKPGQLQGHFEPAIHVGVLKKFVGIMADVFDQPVQRVVLRVDRPDNFVQGFNRVTRGVDDFADVEPHVLLVHQPLFRALAQHHDAGEARTEVVVDVLGDAPPLLFDGVPLLQEFELALHFLARHVTSRARRRAQERQRARPRNHPVSQRCGARTNAREAPASFQTPSLLQAITRKR